MPTNIQPFGTTSSQATPDLAVIKAFGCTVVDFNVSADWASQAGSLSFRLIEDEADGDRLVIPVLGSPHIFELKDTSGNVLFEYIGLVDSFSRSSSNTKTYSVSLTSPLTILNSSQVIMDGFAGLGGSLEANADFSGTEYYDFGHNNNLITVNNSPGSNHWHNISNLINVLGILENDHPDYRVAFATDTYGDFGHSAKSADGIPLIKLIWALHMGINHLPALSDEQKQRTHGGNLLFGRHNYNVIRDDEGVPYYYHFDAIGFYNQVIAAATSIGPQFRVGGSSKSIADIVSEVCQEANLEYFCYIDLNKNIDIDGNPIGEPTLQEDDTNWTQNAICNWPLNPNKFTSGGNYGGTIRIKVLNKNSFFNGSRPFSNIAYNLIGLEVPDIKDEYWTTQNGIHPGKRPINNTDYGLANAGSTIYSDPLDSKGLDFDNEGFTDVGTQSIASGGAFPVATQYWDSGKLSDLKIKSSDVSIKLNDLTTMKVVTGGYQTRLVSVPRKYLRQYWGDIIIPNASDPREVADTATDSLGLNETSTRKVPVVTNMLDPRDVDDFILIDMRSDFADLTVEGVFQNGIYAASMLEVRCAMTGKGSWDTFFNDYKKKKFRNLRNHFFPNCVTPTGAYSTSRDDQEESTGKQNVNDGPGYAGCCDILGVGNLFTQSLTTQSVVAETYDSAGQPQICLSESGTHFHAPVYTESQLIGCDDDGNPLYNDVQVTGQCPPVLTCAFANGQIKDFILPLIYERVKTIGDTHYGKSWYAPVPYLKTIEDLDGNNLVGNFKRSWELTDSAYVEPSQYYAKQIPQSNMFISDGKVSSFVNYDHNFIGEGAGWDENYAADVKNLFNGANRKIFNFSEYNLDSLCITKYGSYSILHASPSNIENQYSFLPYGYDAIYTRTSLPFSSIVTGHRTYWQKYNASGLGPDSITKAAQTIESEDTPDYTLNNGQCTPSLCKSIADDNPPPSGFYAYSGVFGIPLETQPNWLANTVPALKGLEYSDNGRFCFPFIKFTTDRVFLPQPKAGLAQGKGLTDVPSADAYKRFIGATDANGGDPDGCSTWEASYLAASGRARQYKITSDDAVENLQPFKVCVSPKSINYAQVSTRYVYGPWITSLPYISFRGKIEYEQDESLVPENFLIPLGFGTFGSYDLSQTSGLAGMNLAAQGRANAIDDYSLFAVEEGSFSIPGAPAITRIGDGLYGLQQVTDIKINVSSDQIDTTYTFKTISPRFGKNNRDIEKNITKISNKLKKFKLR
tara:strand:+ start:3095 stop:6838 length:3744 start_codon:yes stop_codon:yes gene_type:complete